MNTTEGPVAIVTGPSSGIGKSVARKLLERGYRVHAGARRTDAIADLATLGARVHHLDLTKPDSIEALMAAVLAEGTLRGVSKIKTTWSQCRRLAGSAVACTSAISSCG